MIPAPSITDNPLAQARAVADPAIAEVLDLDTGKHLDAVPYITSHLYQALVEERVEIVTRMVAANPRFVCSICQVPVYLVSKPEQHIFFFRHRHEDGSCPAQTRSPLSFEEICARKYHGLRESEPHKRIKALILRNLAADRAFSETASEKNWRGTGEAASFRRPDVQTLHESGRLAFEVQLSTTFLSVVVGRREFYRKEGALVVWIFGNFDPAYRLLTTDDLLFSNNSNVFVVDEETTRISEQTGIFHLRCHHRRPVRIGSLISDCWEEKIVSFHELDQDRERQRIFSCDYASEEEALRAAIEAEAAQRHAELEDIDRRDFRDFWFAHGRHFRHTPDNREIWKQLRDRLSVRGIELPLYPDLDAELAAMLNMLYSVRQGTPVIWKFAKLVQVGHHIADNHPRQLAVLGLALKVHGHAKTIKEQDTTGKWQTRIEGTPASRTAKAVEGIAAKIRRYDPQFLPDPAQLPLMRFLFPEVAGKVEAYLGKAGESSAD